MKKNLFLLACGIVSMFVISCNREGTNEVSPGYSNVKAGRFDNKPFSWDVSSGNGKNVFIGDGSIATPLGALASDGTTSSIRIDNTIVYPGAVYPFESIKNSTFDSEVKYAKRPYDLIFSFSNPYIIEDIDSEKGFTTYNRKLSEAVNSSNFNNYINANVKKLVDYSAVECFTYSDVQKAFSFNAGLGTLFTTKMSRKSRDIKYKSIYLARLIGTSFDVVFEPNVNGFFKSDIYNEDAKKFKGDPSGGRRDGSTVGQYFTSTPYYTKQITYGKYAYLAIESEYEYSRVKKAIEATFNAWKISGGGKYEEETIDILSKSVVTVLTTGDRSSEPFWGTSLDNLYSVFNVKYDSNFYGFPVYAQMRTVGTDEILKFMIDGPNSDSRGGNGFDNGGSGTGTGTGGTGGGRR
ncbi:MULTISPECIES: hemolysin [Elizabethkingia]|nr:MULTISPECIES: hemolysin [Elizabethkingia]EHM7982276.1 hemolysin [Elizabethkingia anophelis]EHM8033450.1 hemolysin [Elizabethkingia anophelis]EHZ9536301.1 hemolysin [Elizabethkingia anophelis]EKU3674210.1 hemolysin [Elizabethkingia anophelis]EKU4211188.1 hemolysin [Elizabethkingia anophelis]